MQETRIVAETSTLGLHRGIQMQAFDFRSPSGSRQVSIKKAAGEGMQRQCAQNHPAQSSLGAAVDCQRDGVHRGR